jgi:asparagine synthase (glutamine-hydrolysing)
MTEAAGIEHRLNALKRRNILHPAYLDHIRQQHQTDHATYYGRAIWMLLMLEEWLTAKKC